MTIPRSENHPCWRRWLSGLLDLFYPPHCVACGRMGAWLCGRCLDDLPAIAEPVCSQCGAPWAEGGLCPTCRSAPSYLAGVRSVGYHRRPLREAVHALKYEGARVLAEPLAEMLAALWHPQGIEVDVVVPVPLHPRRERQRGYNQSRLLAVALARRIALPCTFGVLTRSRNTPSQVGLTGEERWANVFGAFRCQSAELVGQRVLLIDDVLTTGATLQACADALLKSGADAVWALTLTRAMDRITVMQNAPRHHARDSAKYDL